MTQDQTLRQHWISVMAKSNAELFLDLSSEYIAGQDFETIRAPEVGLTQVRGRMGGTGSQFNVGDMTITRCVVQSTKGHYGYSYIKGRNKDHAYRAAQLDALLQDDEHQSATLASLIQPLEATLAENAAAKANEVAQTKVDFFTLVRGED
ncbi:phosphonate C-P lyase system protein PhnG [Marinomonas sp. C2222]|uniref:Phosphonate C-P lyase system protein PhnG n=1 Tax=Marinomonas sargassi TaxID=2984494 RepID=A0ABT2YPL9_9GAMM|nr:phosphonate C-P lyase system protein PhnG [Marinomonas sargassi]MCV2401820.1 phosphonate C-P lyase system protein PhnG [Marinomonas sargassi]